MTTRSETVPVHWRRVLGPQRAARLVLNPLRRAWLAWRRRSHPGPRVLANSLPKAGTFLLERCLRHLSDLVNYHDGVFVYGLPGWRGLLRRQAALGRMGGGTYVQAHLPHSDEARAIIAGANLRHVLIVRDPRDVVVSLVRFQLARPDLPAHRHFAALGDDQTRYRSAILGTFRPAGCPHIGGELEAYLRWREEGCLVVRFEDLVGEAGGGTADAQRAAVAAVAGHLGTTLDGEGLERVTRALFDPGSRTFRQGRAGAWRKELSAANRELATELCAPSLTALGYPLE